MVTLKKDEIILKQEKAKYKQGRGFRVPTNTKGDLIVTDKRILFEYSKGLISKSILLGMDVPLNTINNVTSEGTLFKKLLIEFNEISSKQALIGNPRVAFEVKNLKEWSDLLQNAINRVED